MFIATTRAGGESAGCLVGFATQCSIDPPRFIVCLSNKNRTFRVARAAEVLVIHCVPADAEDLAELFGSRSGDSTDKFALCDWRAGPDGAPILARCQHWFAGLIRQRVELGDHVGFVLDPIDGAAGGDMEAFSFHRARRLEAGHDA